VDAVISKVDFAGDLFVALGATIAVASVFFWVKTLIRIARSSLDALLRTLLFGLVVFTGPLVGTVIGWLVLRGFTSRRGYSIRS